MEHCLEWKPWLVPFEVNSEQEYCVSTLAPEGVSFFLLYFPEVLGLVSLEVAFIYHEVDPP